MLLITLQVNASFVATDYLQNGYLITAQNSLRKIDSTGKTMFTYNQNLYGQLNQVDATNPLKIILSYPDYGTVVILDNTLSEIATIPLKPLGIGDYHAICFSPRDNNFWVFDDNVFKLKKLDRNSRVILESSDMFQQIGYAIHPVFMQEENQFVYLSDPAIGIVVFDVYGVYYATLPLKNVAKFQVRDNQIFFLLHNQYHTFNLKTFEEKNISLPDSVGVVDIRIESNRLFLLKNESLNIYTF